MNENLKEYLRLFFDESDINEVLLYLVACRLNLDYSINSELFSKLAQNGIIERDFINEKIIPKVPILSADKENVLPEIKIVTDEQVDEYRRLFKNIRQGSIGNRSDVKEKLIRFVNLYNYEFDVIINAVTDMMSRTELKFVPNADNFIFNSKGSPLLTTIEEYNMSESTFKNFA